MDNIKNITSEEKTSTVFSEEKSIEQNYQKPLDAENPECSIENKDISDEKISDLKDQLKEIQNREREKVLRITAEMENLRKRTEQDIEKAHKFALEKFVSALLPVVDSLDRALETANKSESDISAMIEGIRLTLKSILDVMKKFGVEIISEINVPLDPYIHQAIAIVESDTIPSGNIVEVMQKGYILNGRIVRAAMVTVSKDKI